MKRYLFAALFLFLFIYPASAGALTIDFEGLPDSSPVGYSLSTLGVDFSNATVISAGISLNEWEFPPHSGQNVVFDDGGPITLAFGLPLSSFGAYFTHSVPLSLSFYDPLDHLEATVYSVFSSNLAFSGDPGSSPNEYLTQSSALGFSKVVISGDPGGSSFAMDDLGITPVVPEPATILLLACAFLGMGGYASWRRGVSRDDEEVWR